jgi:ParB/RepB/Spo0J family partition protein
MGVEFRQLSLDELVDAGDNVRTDLGDLTGLADSIREHGIMQPIVVDADMRIVSGHRRYAAAQLAGRTDVPVLVNDQIDDVTRLEMMIVENLQRTDLSPFEEAAAFRRLMDLGGHSQRKVASKVGCAQAHISRRLALLQLPEQAHAFVLDGTLTMEDALVLTRATPDDLTVLFNGTPAPWQIANLCDRVRHTEDVDAARKKATATGLPAVTDGYSYDRFEVCDQQDATGWTVRGATIMWVRERPATEAAPRSARADGPPADWDDDDDEPGDPAGITRPSIADQHAVARAQRMAVDAALTAAAADRKSFARSWLADRKNWYGTTAKQRAALDHVVHLTAILAQTDDYADGTDVAAFLGLDDDIDALQAIDLDGPEDRLRVALAYAFAHGEQTLGWATSPAGPAHLHFLADIGRTLEPIEWRRYIDGITDHAQLVTEFDLPTETHP